MYFSNAFVKIAFQLSEEKEQNILIKISVERKK